ncbi:hypothetical protein E2C01_089324 [Portunus trituberculatus]|uniref:Uncharacterized protein n=1 Tax=Portunus trituberculatus TaxID=210409 RepID=A0A5B7JM39_PORTR|nr:hypothetical protein [Portunus trituberculatus]
MSPTYRSPSFLTYLPTYLPPVSPIPSLIFGGNRQAEEGGISKEGRAEERRTTENKKPEPETTRVYDISKLVQPTVSRA